MMKVLTAHTYELDDPEKAIQEIVNQIDIKNSLLKNSIGLLFCHSKFVELGILETLYKNLPFEVIGCTSMYFAVSTQAGPTQVGDIMLTLTVLTSDDVEFAAGICEPLTKANIDDNINALYQKTASSLNAKADLAFAFPPTQLNLTIDLISAALNRACGGTPVFGTVALDMNVHIRNPRVIYKGAAYADRVALLLVKGPVKPRFTFIRFPEKSILSQDAVITSAEGAQIFTINNEPAAVFLKGLGLIQNGTIYTSAIPLVIVDNEGNNPEVIVVQDITPEGTLVCGSQVHVGGVINIGAITADYVLSSAKALAKIIKENESREGLFIFSCFLRGVVLGEGSGPEAELLKKELANYSGSWVYLNSGGELCPRYTDLGETENQALQYALIACQF